MKTKFDSTRAADLEYIEQLQKIQMKNPPTSAAWIEASNELRFMFARMAERDNEEPGK